MAGVQNFMRWCDLPVGCREHTVSDLKKLVSELEQQNATLKTSLEMKPVDSSGDERPLL